MNRNVLLGKMAAVLVFMAACCMTVAAQTSGALTPADTAAVGERRVTTASYAVGYGPTRILDTYLSQEHFSGGGLTFLSSVRRQRPSRRWSTVMQHQAGISSASNRSDDADELEGAYDFFWGRYRSWYFAGDRLHVRAGGMVNVGAGFIYNTLNGNNPAQARIHVNAMPSVAALWRFSLWRLPMCVGYELELPLCGVMFSPNYGQSYYEIFSRGNYDHNIVPTTFVSAPDFRQQIMLDISVSRKVALRVGYLGDYRQAKVNNLKSHIYSHRFMIGIVKRFSIINYRP